MGDSESRTTEGHTGADSAGDSTGESLIRLQLTLWQQLL